MEEIRFPDLDERLRLALAEDIRGGDITGEAIFGREGGPSAKAAIVCKKAGIASGLEVAARVFALMDPRLEVELLAKDGDPVEPGQKVLKASGPAYGLLGAERTALNLLQRLSGTATLARAFVDLVGARARVLDTRKTTPLWRDLQKAAVLHGGGSNHRLGLFDAYMVKDNHVDAAGGIGPALRAVARHREASGAKGREVVLEVRDLAELRQALAAPESERPDVAMLDNMAGDSLREALDVLEGQGVASEVSGGISLETVASFAAAGVDRISVGALTHSAPALDFSMLVRSG
jgi:nicotinate-nucleotide pyrophosphorylase (carboxylating)